MKRKKKRSEMSKAQQYLMSIKDYDDLIEDKIRERDMLYAYITRTTAPFKQDVVSGGGCENYSKEKWIDLKNELDQDIDHFYDLKKEANALLNKLLDVNMRYYDVLHRRYILFDTLEDIAADKYYSYRWVCELHGRALQAFDKILQEEEKHE